MVSALYTKFQLSRPRSFGDIKRSLT